VMMFVFVFMSVMMPVLMLMVAVFAGFFRMMMCHSPIVFLGTKVLRLPCNRVANSSACLPGGWKHRNGRIWG